MGVFRISQESIDEDITSNSAETKKDASAVPQVNKLEVGCFNVVGRGLGKESCQHKQCSQGCHHSFIEGGQWE